jgi:hypothetical protein
MFGGSSVGSSGNRSRVLSKPENRPPLPRTAGEIAKKITAHVKRALLIFDVPGNEFAQGPTGATLGDQEMTGQP